MEENLRNGTSIKRQEPLSLCIERIGLGTFKETEGQATCKLITPTQNGSSYSSLTDQTHSSVSTTIKFLMLLEGKTKKATMFKSGEETSQRLSNGNSSMLTKLKNLLPRDLIKSMVWKETDHSILSQSFQWKELLNAGVLATSFFVILSMENWANNSSMMEFQRLSSLNNGKIDL
jgi:hypothetical protein